MFPAGPIATPLLLCVGAFFLGAIPFGFIAGKMRGIDLREKGSGNIGATNTLRVLGVGPGVTVLLLDAAKGYAPVALAQDVLRLGGWWTLAVGLSAVLGHTYSPYVRFKGGKGVATSLGVLIGLSPIIAGGSLLVFVVTVALTRYVSLGSILGAITSAILFLLLPGYHLASKAFGLLAAFFILIRHRSNIRRLLAGTENRLGSKSEAAPPSPSSTDKTSPL